MFMKRIAALLLGGLLTTSLVFAAEPSATDQKWLHAVEKMVSKGEMKVSTPIEERVSLVKEWAAKNGYAAKVTKTETGYAIELRAKEAGKTIAQK